MPSILITGANRGIGLELARQYKAAGWDVVGTARDPASATALAGLGAEVVPLEVAEDASIAALATKLKGRKFDILMNNAGINSRSSTFGSIDSEDWLRLFRVNTIAPIKVLEAFADNLTGRKIAAFISSMMGSVTHAEGGAYLYRSSKAALNSAVKNLSIDLQPRGITCILLHPGWVQTDMGGKEAAVTPKDSVTGLKSVLDKADASYNGKFLNFDGGEWPW
jgi:NAD(P)-dependent dehydrogenase (short-subunit alcohol dehydrogenase family)